MLAKKEVRVWAEFPVKGRLRRQSLALGETRVPVEGGARLGEVRLGGGQWPDN